MIISKDLTKLSAHLWPKLPANLDEKSTFSIWEEKSENAS